jgi:hypothetical protein
LVDEHLRGRRDRSSDLWILLVFELWHRNFLSQRQGSANAGNQSIWVRPPGQSTPEDSGEAVIPRSTTKDKPQPAKGNLD